METAIFVARIISIIYIAFGLGFLINGRYYRVVLLELLGSTSFLLLGAILAIVNGMAIIYFHNYWDFNWRVMITVIGWVSLIKGIYILVFPSSFFVIKSLLNSNIFANIMVTFTLFLGLVLGYLSFF